MNLPCNTWSSRFLSARHIAQNQKTFENFPTKKHIAIPITRGRDKRLTWPWIDLDLALSWRIGARLFDAGEICELRLHTVTCLASLYVGKQHRTNNEPQNSIKWRELRPGYTEKAITGPSLCKYNLFLYLCLYFYGLTTILNFLLKVFKSFVISAKQYRNLRYRGGSRIFLRGGALVSCSTSKPINHIVFFFFGRILVVLENRRSSQGGVRIPCTLPLDPLLR